MLSSSTRTQVYQMDDPCYDIGGGVPPIGIKVKYPMCGISRTLQVVSLQAFASMRRTHFIEIDDERGEIVQRYESFGRD
jgi:hypothetical protein